jgi:hypothetical protein
MSFVDYLLQGHSDRIVQRVNKDSPSLTRTHSGLCVSSVLLAKSVGMPDFERRVWIIIEEEVRERNEVVFVPPRQL